jgi:hypothetical protein
MENAKMSWLDYEAEKHQQATDSANRQQEVIRLSNYWALIVDALRSAAEAINSHRYWKPLVEPFPVKFVKARDAEEWQVVRSGMESVRVGIQNKYDHILVSREFSNSAHYKEFNRSGILRIAACGDTVVLVTDDGEKLLMPEDVAQYLLRGVLATLQTSVPSRLSAVN